jgi:hypothetical protein
MIKYIFFLAGIITALAYGIIIEITHGQQIPGEERDSIQDLKIIGTIEDKPIYHFIHRIETETRQGNITNDKECYIYQTSINCN